VGVVFFFIHHDRATDLYLREWLADGVRRPLYYRTQTAGGALAVADVERWWPGSIDAVHLTGITPALGAEATAAIRAALGRARAEGVLVSVDPNHRPRLWSADEARPVLLELARAASILLLSIEDAEVMFETSGNDASIIAAAHELGPEIVVVKRGADGAVVSDRTSMVHVPAESVDVVVDPVGAGDAFDAGFLAGHLRGWGLERSARLGAQCGAAVVGVPGEHEIQR